jgi:hypothetical protein
LLDIYFMSMTQEQINVNLFDEVKKLQCENAETKEANRRFEAAFVRIARAHGIDSPLILISMAENNDENYAEILARHIEHVMSNAGHHLQPESEAEGC